jgi:DNA-binding PadR family transcriptional regulator
MPATRRPNPVTESRYAQIMTRRRLHDPAAALPLTHVVYHVLLALASGDRHGYGIIKHVADRTDGRVELEAGTLYAVIKRLKDDGWIAEAPRTAGTDSRRRTYAISEIGREILLAESRRLEELVELAREAHVLPDRAKAEA